MLTIYSSPQTNNRCYQKATPISPVGILIHSTGAVNQNLSRYVDDVPHLGPNRYGNHWNRPSVSKCMHAFIGLDKDGCIAVAQTLPYTIGCWGCGKGRNGSYNAMPHAHLQFEVCEGNASDAAYYHAAMETAEAYCAMLCRQFGWGAEVICSHREAATRGYASNHGDPERWMKHFGDSMDAFRARVAARLAADAPRCTVIIRGIPADEAEKLRAAYPSAEVNADE